MSPHPPIISQKTLRKVAEQAELSSSYLLFMGMAGVLAAIAMLTNSVPVLIGSMVVAPALPPLALVSCAIVARKPRLALRGFSNALLGLFVAMLFSILTTWIMNVTNVIPPETNLLNKPLLEERVRPGWYSVAVAIAAGIAGAVAMVKQKTDTLVGVVAALALVPAVAAASIAFMSKSPLRGFGGLMLLAINVGFIILTGVLTLIVMRPKPQD